MSCNNRKYFSFVPAVQSQSICNSLERVRWLFATIPDRRLTRFKASSLIWAIEDLAIVSLVIKTTGVITVLTGGDCLKFILAIGLELLVISFHSTSKNLMYRFLTDNF